MTVTFGSVELKNPSKRKGEFQIITSDVLLLSGRHSIQSNSEYGYKVTYDCLGDLDDVDAILAVVNTALTLTEGAIEHTNCFIAGNIPHQETDAPGLYIYTVSFVQDTT